MKKMVQPLQQLLCHDMVKFYLLKFPLKTEDDVDLVIEMVFDVVRGNK